MPEESLVSSLLLNEQYYLKVTCEHVKDTHVETLLFSNEKIIMVGMGYVHQVQPISHFRVGSVTEALKRALMRPVEEKLGLLAKRRNSTSCFRWTPNSPRKLKYELIRLDLPITW